MRKVRPIRAVGKVGLSLLISVTASVAWAQGSAARVAAPAAAASAAAEDSIRASLGALLQAAQELVRGGKGAEALAKIREAEALPEQTPFEKFTISRIKAGVAQQAGNQALAMESLAAAVATGRFNEADRQVALQTLASLAIRLKDSEATIRWANEYLRAGGPNPQVREALAKTLFIKGDMPAALRAAGPLVSDAEAGNRKPLEDHLRLVFTIQDKLGDETGAMLTLEKLVVHHPNPDYWGDLLSRLQRRAGFPDRLLLDTFRLLRHTGAIEDGADYVNMAQLAQLAALPGEAKAVLDEGFDKGTLGKGKDAKAQQELRARVDKAAADDKAGLAAGEAAALKSGDGNRIFAVGAAALSYGQTDKALALMEQGIKVGLKRNPDDGRIAYGVALIRAGRKADGESQLKAVQGADGAADVARLWLLALR